MSFEAVSTVYPEYLHIKASTDYTLECLFKFLGYVRSEVDRTQQKRVFIDSRDFRGSMTEADRFMGGQKIAELFGSRIKIALLMPGAQITKLGEITAVNRGAKFFVTDCEDEGRRWLLAD